jgi:hypothetical protein
MTTARIGGFGKRLYARALDVLRWHLGLRICGIYVKELVPSSEPDPVIPDVTCRIFDKQSTEDLLAHVKDPGTNLSVKFVSSALAKGDVCEALICDGRIVSFKWHAFTRTHDADGVYVEFGKNFRYVYHAFTLPEYRGRHWPRTFAVVGDRYCISRGCTHSIAFIAVGNRSSIRSALATGGRRIGYAGYFKRGPLFIAFRTSGPRRLGFRFFMPVAAMESRATELA